MANADTPNGFVPYRHVGGGTIRADQYEIASAYNASIKKGDAVILASGLVNIAAQDSASILGVFKGVHYIDSAGNQVFSNQWPANQVTLGSANAIAEVYTDPGISYSVQCEDTATIANVGVAYDIGTDQAGSTVTGVSGMEIDLGDTGTGQFMVLGLIDTPNNAFGANARVEVINNVPLMR